VHERIGGGHVVGHHRREALDPHPLVGPEATAQGGAQLLVAPAQGDDEDIGQLERDVDGSMQVADAPAAARHQHDPRVIRKPKGAARLESVARLQVHVVVEAGDGLDARVRGDPADLLLGLGMDDQVDVDARMGPVAQRREVGDGGDDGHVDAAALAELADHLAGRGEDRDDQVGAGRPQRACHAPAAEQGQQHAGAPARGREALADVVLEIEQAVAELGVERRPLQEGVAHWPAEDRQAVGDRHRGAALAQGVG